MKKILMTMAALLSMTAAMAQQSDNTTERKAPQPPTAEEVTNRMAQSLGLSDDQKAKLLKLNTEYQDVLGGRGGMGRGPRGPRPDGQTGATEKQPQKRERGERPQLSDEQKQQMAARMEKRRKYDAELKKILTDEQYKTFQQNNQRRFGRGGGRRGNHRQRPDVN